MKGVFGILLTILFLQTAVHAVDKVMDRLSGPRCAIYPASFGRAARLL